jgi:Fe-S-cluster containining protein
MSAETRAPCPDPTGLEDQVRPALMDLYREVDEAVARFGPSCELSGRCCRFREYGHVLFLTRPEALVLIADAPAPVRSLDDDATCPWQDRGGRCTARDARPLGCRIFFCDPSFETHAQDLSERYLARLKGLVEEHDWPWDYARLHDHLCRARAEGRLEVVAVHEDPRPREDRGPPAEAGT